MPLYDYSYNLIAENLELFRFFYSMLIAFICLVVVVKTDRLFKISSHQGIRYFRNAFFFYGVAFVLRYCLTDIPYFFLVRAVFQFFMIMAGFFLLYSLLWKKFETNEKNKSSFFNPVIFLFYLITIIIILLDYLWNVYTFMFLSQILLFGLASIISCINYKKNGEKHKFLGLYFVIMILSFFAWFLNFVFGNYLGWQLKWLANIYALNTIVFLVFLYEVIKLTRKQD